MGIEVVETGSFVPATIVRNEDLARLGYDADWILQRTGIRERRHAPPEMATSDMATEAAERCIERAGVDRSDIDLVVLAPLPPTCQCPRPPARFKAGSV